MTDHQSDIVVVITLVAAMAAYGWLCMFIGALCPSCPLFFLG